MFEKALAGAGGAYGANAGVGGAFVFPKLADQIIPLIRQKSYLRKLKIGEE
jgi:hypothetical protein